MLKNRELRIKMVNPINDPTPVAEPEADFEEKVAHAANAVNNLIWSAAGAVVIYVAVDTVRRVFVELAKK